MEQPPGSLDDLQPQDLSTSSIPTVIDLTRKGEECVLHATSLDALRMVKTPGWFPNSDASNPGLPFLETSSSDIELQPRNQVQPDNAFSHTTVTLSYVSRSHVFPHDSLSQHSPLCSMPPVSKFSCHPPCDSDKGLQDTGYALNQHYLEPAEGPVDLATQVDLLKPLSQAQPENDRGVCLAQGPHMFNGGAVSSDGDTDMHVRVKEDQELCKVLENGHDNSWSSSGICAESSPETLTPITVEEENGSSDVLFLMDKKQEPVVVPNSTGAKDLFSLSREYTSPLEDPVSPSATSLDDVEDVFVLPQASSSPSGDNSYQETAEDSVCDGSSTEGGIQPGSGVSDNLTSLDSINENKQPVCRRKAAIEPLIDLTGDVLEDQTKLVLPHMNGNTTTLREKKLPVRSGRGTRLEAIVMNINSSRYRVSGRLRTDKKASASQSAASDCSPATPKRKCSMSVGERKVKARASASVKTLMTIGKTDRCKDSTSDSEILSNSIKSHCSVSPKSPRLAACTGSKTEPRNASLVLQSPQTSPAKPTRRPSSQTSPHKNSQKEIVSPSDPSVDFHITRLPPPPPQSLKSPKKCPGKSKSVGIKTSRAPKRRQKKHKRIPSSSMFSPKEPEIKLRYVNYKEEKRDLRLDSFSPFIRVAQQQSSVSQCTIINYPEEARKGQQPQAHPGGFISAVVPTTSCLQLGRLSMHSQHQRSLVCCLCGQSANAMDLGDLHGPYYPEGFQPSGKTPASMTNPKEDEDNSSDSDFSSCRGRGRRRAIPPALWPLSKGAQLDQQGLLESYRWSDDRSSSPAAKRARSVCGSAEDWYSPPLLPLEPCEFWLHEDCGVWSAGVFLIKGKVYGLEEAVKVAQETVTVHFQPLI